ncbi:aminopeptidase [bacterium]|nr:aminopeptidase [bacterium]
MVKLREAAQIAINTCMQAKENEVGLIITDEPLRNIGYLLFEEAAKVSREALLVEIKPRISHASEPPQQVAELMRKVDYILAPTSKSLSHTDARRNACKGGVRCATLPAITEDTMLRALNADYHKIAELSEKLARLLTDGTKARVTTKSGTDILLELGDRRGHPDTGLVHTPGGFSNLPAGEAYIAPVEGKSGGIFMVDGSMAGIGIIDRNAPIRVDVSNGRAVEISGCEGAQKLQQMLSEHGENAYNIAELGIGTNYKAEICGNTLEDEKVYGTVHIALGDNASMGGNVVVDLHLDGVILNPTLYIDDKLVIENGVYRV